MMNTRQVNRELILATTTATAAKASLENIHLRNADYFMIIASFLYPLLFTDRAASGLLEAPLK